MSLLTNNLWLGDLDSFDSIFMMEKKLEKQIEKALDKGVKLDLYSGYDEADDEDGPEYQLVDGIAIVPVRGSLISSETWFSRLFGMSSYEGIKRMVGQASEDEAVDRIVLDINSPGGTSEGVDEAGLFIKQIDSDIKPVHAYTSGAMNSAAYWLGSACRDITCTRMSQIGSIGVVTIHQEYSKNLKDRGIETTIFRDGKYKAKPNPYEKLTKEDITRMNSSLKILGDFFLDWVSQERGFDRNTVRASVGEGAVFFGSEGVENGLADRLMFFDDFIQRLIKLEGSNDSAYDSNVVNLTRMSAEDIQVALASAMKLESPVANGADETPQFVDTNGDTDMSVDKTKVSKAAGIKFMVGDKEMSLEQVEASIELGVIELTDELKDTIAKAKEQLSSETSEGTEGEGSAALDSDASAGEAADLSSTEDSTEGGDPVLAHIQDQLNTQLSENTKLQLELDQLKKAEETRTSQMAELTEIALNSCQKMTIAMGGTPVGMKDADVAAVLKHHQSLSEQFSTNFKTGGVAAVELTSETSEDQEDTSFRAPLSSVSFKSN